MNALTIKKLNLKNIIKLDKYFMRISLSSYFLIYIAMFICLFIFFSALIGISDYRGYIASQTKILEENAANIQSELIALFDTISHIQTSMGKQILNHGSHDLKYILELFNNHNAVITHASVLYSRDLYDWVDSSLSALIVSKLGIIEPVDLSFRDYLQESKKTPWKLCISSPIKNYFTRESILATATGITNHKRKYLGSIVVSINIERLTDMLSQTIMSNKIHFAIINNKGQIIVSSNKDVENLQKCMDLNNITTDLKILQEREGNLPQPIQNDSIIYSYYKEITDYPYYLLLGLDHNIVTKEILSLLMPQIYEFLALSGVCFLLLAFFQHWFIKPVQHLSRQAKNLVHQKQSFRSFYIKSIEFYNLSKALMFVKRHLQNNRRIQKKLEISNEYLEETNIKLSENQKLLEITQKKLEDAIHIARESDLAKEEFLKQVHEDLKNPLHTILESTKNIAELSLNIKDSEEKKEFLKELQTIYHSAIELKTFTRSDLNLSLISIQDIIEECIKIHKKIAFEKNINIDLFFDEELSFIFADEFRLTQSFVGILYRSINNVSYDGLIQIKTSNVILNEKKYVNISIIDNGFGLNELDMRRINKNFPKVEGVNIIELEIETIRKLIELHGGKLETSVDFGKGTRVNILLPIKV